MLEIEPVTRPNWTPLEQDGVVNVTFKSLLAGDRVHLAMLHFEQEATVHEHAAEIDVDVICLEGQGFTSVGEEKGAIVAGERVHWPAGKPHRLWTTNSEMITLMVEHPTRKAEKPAWEDVDSSMISAFKYDEVAETLDVIFHRTGVYRYFDVPAHIVRGLRQTSSKGSYMRSMIIGAYDDAKGD